VGRGEGWEGFKFQIVCLQEGRFKFTQCFERGVSFLTCQFKKKNRSPPYDVINEQSLIHVYLNLLIRVRFVQTTF
jgi:hypothetical protein